VQGLDLDAQAHLGSGMHQLILATHLSNTPQRHRGE